MPCVAVTAFAAVSALSAGMSGRRAALLAAAILVGQLSVGWCNDYVDRTRDVTAGRSDKPIATGAVPARVVGAAAVAALLACVALSFALGVVPGVLHLLAVASAWSYNTGLKSTAASPLPFAVSFGLLPAIVATALPGTPTPRPAVVAAGALLGVAAHFANTVRDEDVDAATGIRGLPQRIGPRRSVAVTALLVAVAALLLLAVLRRTPATVALLTAGAVVAATGVGAARHARATRSPLVFRLAVGAAGLVVLGFATSGSALTVNP